MNVASLHLLLFGAVGLLLLSLAGCRPDTLAEQLQGRWVGEPDPAAGVVLRPNSEGELVPQVDPDTGEVVEYRTDLEAHPVRITLEFHDGAHVTMWKNEREERIEGSWQLISTTDSRALLELTDQPPEIEQPGPSPAPEAKQEEKSEAVQRRFELKMAPEGASFTLQEDGADKRFGRLLFKRAAPAE